MAITPLYFVVVYCEEQHGEPNQDLLALLGVMDEPVIYDGTPVNFLDAWNDTKRHLRSKGLSSEWLDIVDALRHAGFVTKNYGAFALHAVEA